MDSKNISIKASPSATDNITNKNQDAITCDINKLYKIGGIKNKIDSKSVIERVGTNTDNNIDSKNVNTGNTNGRATD